METMEMFSPAEIAEINDAIEHSGVKRRSGRYRYGSGEVPYQHEPWFEWGQEVARYRDKGLSWTDVAKAMGMNTAEFRARVTENKLAKNAAERAFARRLREARYSVPEISRRIGTSESTIRNYLNDDYQLQSKVLDNTKSALKDAVGSKKYIDISDGTETYLNVAKTRLNAAVKSLTDSGDYQVVDIFPPQVTNPNHKTHMKILVPKGVDAKEVYQHMDEISYVGERITDDGDRSNLGLRKPTAVSKDRIVVDYGDGKGDQPRDGIIMIRRGTEDLSLGKNRYAQVRINVEDQSYIKAMAVYGEDKDFPPGKDIIVFSNKPKGADLLTKVLKPLKTTADGKIDWDNPFGSAINDSHTNESGMLIGGQREYIDPKDGKKKLSAINIVNEEGEWGEWKKTLSSQVLGKQPLSLAKQQLDLAYKMKRERLDEVLKIENPEVRKSMLQSIADDYDTAAAELKAAALPRQASKVILPATSLKPNECYAPTYRDGEVLALIRHPHQGRFEIVEVTVNNRNKEGQRMIGLDAPDAICIHPSAAHKLSGADFDGDTVLAIPNNSGAIKSQPVLKGLEGFEPKQAYPGYEGMVKMTEVQKQAEMGRASNLITDMTLQNAPISDIVKATKHAQVVIDAAKHGLNWKQSEIDNQIALLKTKYQGGPNAGASTLLSQANASEWVDEIYERYKIDPKTGERVFTKTGRTYDKYERYTADSKRKDPETGEPLHKKGDYKIDPETGERKKKTVRAVSELARMDTVDDANELSRGTPMEKVYAKYANNCKAMANEARLALLGAGTYETNKDAALQYADEVRSLYGKLAMVDANKPKERKANLVAQRVVEAKIADNPELRGREYADQLAKIRTAAIKTARARMGTTSRRYREIDITPREWEAIKNNALPPTRLRTILGAANADKISSYAIPRSRVTIPNDKLAYARAQVDAGKYSISTIADRIGVPTSTLYDALNKGA